MNEESRSAYETRKNEGYECRYEPKYSVDVKGNSRFEDRGRKRKHYKICFVNT